MPLTLGFAFRSMLLASVLGTSAFAAKCNNDQPIRFWFYPVVTLQDGTTIIDAAIKGDGNWYSSTPGYGATINLCSGTYDATLLLPTKRKIFFTFPAPIDGSFVDAEIPAGTYPISAFINVRNLLCVGCANLNANPHEPFTTHVAMQLPSLIKNKRFQLRFMPMQVEAPDLHINPEAVAEQNIPYNSSPARVFPQPFDCLTGGPTKPSWIVKGNIPNEPSPGLDTPVMQVGTAHDVSGTPSVRAGQYSMPFEFRIEALQCFSY